MLPAKPTRGGFGDPQWGDAMKLGLSSTLGMALAAQALTPVSAQTAEPASPDATLAVAEAAAAAATVSDDTPAPKSASTDEGWNVAFTPYVWVAGTKGDIGIPRNAGEDVEIDKSFADVLGNLNFAFMGALDVEHKRLVLLADLMYLSVTAKAEGIQDPAFFEGKVDASVLVATAAAGYRVVDQGSGYLDVFVGGRLTSIDVDVELEGPLQTRRAGASPSNLAPVIGARARIPVGKKWGIALFGDAAGLVDSDVKWQLVGTIQRDLGSHWRLAAGYRHMQIHHSTNRLDFDVSLSGPIVGVTYKF